MCMTALHVHLSILPLHADLHACCCSLEAPSPALLRKHGGGAHGFLGLQGRVLIASPRDPVQYSALRWKNRVSKSVRVVTHSGHQDLTLDRQGSCHPC